MRSRTIGRTVPVSSASSSGPTSRQAAGVLHVADHDRQRLAPAVLALARSAATAAASVASHARWKPPRPLTATMWPVVEQASRVAHDRRGSRATPARRSRCGLGSMSHAADQTQSSRRGPPSAASAGERRLASRAQHVQVQARAADEAGVRLGVEAPVRRVAVLGRALRGTSGTTASSCSGRSYGMSSMIVKRGPQFVQLMNG